MLTGQKLAIEVLTNLFDNGGHTSHLFRCINLMRCGHQSLDRYVQIGHHQNLIPKLGAATWCCYRTADSQRGPSEAFPGPGILQEAFGAGNFPGAPLGICSGFSVSGDGRSCPRQMGYCLDDEDRDPEHGPRGVGSSSVFPRRREAFEASASRWLMPLASAIALRNDTGEAPGPVESQMSGCKQEVFCTSAFMHMIT